MRERRRRRRSRFFKLNLIKQHSDQKRAKDVFIMIKRNRPNQRWMLCPIVIMRVMRRSVGLCLSLINYSL